MDLLRTLPKNLINHPEDMMMAIIIPYSPIHSAKMRIRIIPTKIPSVWAKALTPASPATPMASPDARAERPQQRPAPNN